MENIDQYGRVFSVRLDHELAHDLHTYIVEGGYTKNEVLVACIREFLDLRTKEQPIFEMDLASF